MSLHFNDFLQQCTQNAPHEHVSKLEGERKYFLIENHDTADLRIGFDKAPDVSLSEGIVLAGGERYELWEPFAPDNIHIYIRGTNGDAIQNFVIVEA